MAIRARFMGGARYRLTRKVLGNEGLETSRYGLLQEFALETVYAGWDLYFVTGAFAFCAGHRQALSERKGHPSAYETIND
jgi:hypothetical protein